MNHRLIFTTVIKSLERIQIDERVVYAQYGVGESPILDPVIKNLVTSLEKDHLVLLFHKRLPSLNQVALIAVGVTPKTIQNLILLVKRSEQKLKAEIKGQSEIDVEVELKKVYG